MYRLVDTLAKRVHVKLIKVLIHIWIWNHLYQLKWCFEKICVWIIISDISGKSFFSRTTGLMNLCRTLLMVSSFLSYSGEEQKMKNGNVLWFWFEIMVNFKCYMCFCVYMNHWKKTKYGSFINVVTNDNDFLPISLICDFSKQNP